MFILIEINVKRICFIYFLLKNKLYVYPIGSELKYNHARVFLTVLGNELAEWDTICQYSRCL